MCKVHNKLIVCFFSRKIDIDYPVLSLNILGNLIFSYNTMI